MPRKLFTLIFVILLALGGLTGCGDDEEYYDEQSYQEEEAPAQTENRETSPAKPAPISAASNGEPGSWLVMLYQAADDQILEKDIFIDLNEAELVGSSDSITIVSQIDRYEDGFDGDGDWHSTKRFLVLQDDDLHTINSEELEDLGEVDMGDLNTLVEFATWAIETYPAEKYVLVMSDHGAGWLGGWNDDDPYEGSSLTMAHIDEALETILQNTGIDAFELVGFDACLMGQMEVFSAIAPHARYAVASAEVEPALGWAYADFLQSLTDNPGMDGRDLAQSIVDSYIDQDFRITDDNARRDLVEETFGVEGDYSAEEVAREMSQDITLTAVDLSVMRDLAASINDFVAVLSDVDQKQIAKARTYAQSYESVFGDDEKPSYIDLGHFAALVSEKVKDNGVMEAASAVIDNLQLATIAEKHGEKRPGSTGMSIYFPNSGLFETTAGGSEISYTEYATRFAAASLWDDFLTFHYTGEEIDFNSADLDVLLANRSQLASLGEAAKRSQPSAGAVIVSPARGEISLAPVSAEPGEITVDETLTLTTEVTGVNIGYIYYYVAWYEPESDSYLTADMGFVGSEEIKEVGGVYFPDWGDEPGFELSIDWEPTLYYLSNGYSDEDIFAFFEPEVYGSTPETDIYSVNGIFTYADTGQQRHAVMKFGGDGKMKALYGFTGKDGTGAMHEISPRANDTFTVFEEWLEFDANEDSEFVNYEGGTMTFRDKPVTMEAYYGYSGEYLLGFIIEDLDGKTVEAFVPVTVSAN
jgi:hypothetical protein